MRHGTWRDARTNNNGGVPTRSPAFGRAMGRSAFETASPDQIITNVGARSTCPTFRNPSKIYPRNAYPIRRFCWIRILRLGQATRSCCADTSVLRVDNTCMAVVYLRRDSNGALRAFLPTEISKLFLNAPARSSCLRPTCVLICARRLSQAPDARRRICPHRSFAPSGKRAGLNPKAPIGVVQHSGERSVCLCFCGRTARQRGLSSVTTIDDVSFSSSPGEILFGRSFEPPKASANIRLAKAIGKPQSAISEIAWTTRHNPRNGLCCWALRHFAPPVLAQSRNGLPAKDGRLSSSPTSRPS